MSITNFRLLLVVAAIGIWGWDGVQFSLIVFLLLGLVVDSVFHYHAGLFAWRLYLWNIGHLVPSSLALKVSLPDWPSPPARRC